jgi:hypothetical protein
VVFLFLKVFASKQWCDLLTVVAVKYFKTEGDTNILLYSTNEGLTWKSHKFYPTPIR